MNGPELMLFTTPRIQNSRFLPITGLAADPLRTNERAGRATQPQIPWLMERRFEALGEAIFVGDLADATRHLNYFRGVLARSRQEADQLWQHLETIAEGRLLERSEKALLEAAIESPRIPWKQTDQHLLFLARALQENDLRRAEEEKRFFASLIETSQPLYADVNCERAYNLADAFSNRLDWENPYATREWVNQAITFAMEHVAAAVSRYLATRPPIEDPKAEELRGFFRQLSLDRRLMFVVGAVNPEEPATARQDDLSEQEEQYLGGNAIFFRQMMAAGYLTVFGNVVLGSLALLQDEQARNKFLTAQYRNIRSLAKRYDTPGIDRLDLIQTAWLGLQKALEIYEPWQGTLFWTIAKKWVFGAIILEFKKTLHFVRMTEPIQELDGESYQDALESLIEQRSSLDYVTSAESVSEFTHDEACRFVDELVPVLDEHDRGILLAWIREPNMVKVADQFGTSKQNVANALSRIQSAGRQLARERRMMPQATWERFRRAELSAQSQRLRLYAEKKAAEGPPTTRLKLRSRRTFAQPAKPSQKLRPLLAAEKAGLLAIAQRHFDEDGEGKAGAIKKYREVFFSGNDEQVRHYLADLTQRLDFDSDSLKDQFYNLGILNLLQTLAWRSKTAAMAEAAQTVVQGKILAEREPPYTDVVLAARQFLQTFPNRLKTPDLEQSIQQSLAKLPK
jgi:RNA polymerase sigma factor (sigma-70 family)